MAFNDTTFGGHANWLAFQRSSFEWPKTWRAVIFKIDRRYDPLTDKHTYLVLPRNPEYDKYTDDDTAKWYTPAPPMHLGVVEFDSMDDINRWAAVAHRIK